MYNKNREVYHSKRRRTGQTDVDKHTIGSERGLLRMLELSDQIEAPAIFLGATDNAAILPSYFLYLFAVLRSTFH